MELKKIEAGQREAVAKVASLFLSLQPEEQLKLCSMLIDVGRILRTFKIKKNVEVTDNGKIII